MNNRANLLIVFMLLVITSCNQHPERTDVDVSNVQVEDVTIKRYEKELFTIDKSNLRNELFRLQPQYPVFLEGDLNDTLDLMKLADYVEDTMLINVYQDCETIFPNLTNIENQLTDAFKHYKYYYPEASTFSVFTYISGFDYQHAVQLIDDNMLISIDMFLGADYSRYKHLGVPLYVLQRFDKGYILRDCMYALGHRQIDLRKKGNSLLDNIILNGKLLWFLNAMIPDISKSSLLNYSDEQLRWVQDNEPNIWAFLIENELLFTTELQPYQKFILDAPFTSYFGNDSPPRLGWWIGYKIVKSYMNKNQNIGLDELMQNNDAQSILTNSGYKPKY